MAVEDGDDRATMLADFGVSATYNSTSVTGILDKQYFDEGVESSKPTFTCKTTDVPTAAHGDTLSVNSVSYVVRGVQPDGDGMTILVLEEQ